jgi:uncharacterized membrane protein
MTTLLIFYLATGTLLVVLSLPLLLGKVGPNALYGFRVSRTLNDPRVWDATNRFAARRLIAAAVSIMAAAVALYFVPGVSLDVYALACLGVFAVVFTVGLVQSVRYMRSIAPQEPS